MTEFGRLLPTIRAAVPRDLARRDLSRKRVRALLARLLAATLIRVGNDEHGRDNGSFGPTMLRRRHPNDEGERPRFDFKGKSGVRHAVTIGDRRRARLVRQVAELPGQRLFQGLDEDGTRHRLGSADVNAWLKAVSDADITAKAFRTWAATLAACVKDAARPFGNTPAVCRAACIHPRLFTCCRAGADHLPREGRPRRIGPSAPRRHG